MIYYDIHTHHLPEIYDENIVSIFNTYPLEYDKYRTSDNPNLYYSVGIHPWYLDDVDRQYDALVHIAKDRRVIAIGEAGLDKLCGTNMDLQIDIFRKQIEISIETNKPMIIHCVKAWNELVDLYKKYRPSVPWIIHGFRGNGILAKQLSSLGLNLSFGEKFQPSAIGSIAKESIFIETDESKLTIISICYEISEMCGISLDELLGAVEANVVKTFRM